MVVVHQCRPLGGTMTESLIESNLPVKWADMLGEWETFSALLKVIEEEKRVPYRQILSHHMTTSCQPGKVPGPVSSLKACGIEDKKEGLVAGLCRLDLHLPSSFEAGDGLLITCNGKGHTKFKDCQT